MVYLVCVVTVLIVSGAQRGVGGMSNKHDYVFRDGTQQDVQDVLHMNDQSGSRDSLGDNTSISVPV